MTAIERKETDEFILELEGNSKTFRVFEYTTAHGKELYTQDNIPVTKVDNSLYEITGTGRARRLDPPVNVAYAAPLNPPDDWEQQAQQWRSLNERPYHYNGQNIIGHGGFYPLTIKAAYVIGIIYNGCNAVSELLSNGRNWEKFYMLAYGIFASTIELLGRCLQGNNTTYTKPKGAKNTDIVMGFKWLKKPSYPEFQNENPTSNILENYSINDLVYLRHFAAHGRATSKIELQEVDYTLLEKLVPKLIDGLEAYWTALGPSVPPQTSEYMCNKLAHAQIVTFQDWAVFDSWIEFQTKQSITATFGKFRAECSVVGVTLGCAGVA